MRGDRPVLVRWSFRAIDCVGMLAGLSALFAEELRKPSQQPGEDPRLGTIDRLIVTPAATFFATAASANLSRRPLLRPNDLAIRYPVVRSTRALPIAN